MTRQNTSPVEMASPGFGGGIPLHPAPGVGLAALPFPRRRSREAGILVFTFLGSRPGPFQKDAVSLSKMLTWTIQSRFCNAFRTLLEFGRLHAGFWPTGEAP